MTGNYFEDDCRDGRRQQETETTNDARTLMGLFEPPSIPSTPERSTEIFLSNRSTTDAGARADVNAPDGSVSHMMGLFAPSLAKGDNLVYSPSSPDRSHRMETLLGENILLEKQFDESAPLLLGGCRAHTPQSSVDMKLWAPSSGEFDKTPIAYGGVGSNNGDSNSTNGHVRHGSAAKHIRMPSFAMPSISESRAQIVPGQLDKSGNSSFLELISQSAKDVVRSLKIPTTYIGSFVYVLYHVVFCLAMGSAIMRPNSSVSILGLMTKTAALGTLAASPIYWCSLSREVPALYPTADLFLTPFLAKLALIVDQTLADDSAVSEQENDAVFLASFGVLTAIGTAISACLILAASVFKLANLGSYLPFPVICGFFAAVGILTWTLAINVDTGGTSIGTILTSYDFDLIRYALIHHIPTLIVAGFMKYLGPKNPFFVCLVVVVTIALFYFYMLVTETSFQEMMDKGWFWSHDDLVYENNSSTLGFDRWAPPAPLGVPVVIHHVHWGAVWNGISTAVAMSFLYVIRCSVYVS